MMKKNLSLISFLIYLLLGLMFLSSISIEYFPNSNFIKESLKNRDTNVLQFSPQYFFFTFFEFLNIKINDNYYPILILFFIINSLGLLLLLKIDDLIVYGQKLNQSKYNYLLFLSLSMPSVLLSITTPSAESLVTIISIFIIFRIMEKNLKFYEILLFIILLFYSFILDSGNTIVFMAFLLYLTIINLIKFKINLIEYFFIFFVLLSVTIFFSENIVLFIANFFQIAKKGNVIIENIYNLGLHKKEFMDIFLRYLYFWSTLLGVVDHFKNFTFTILPVFLTLLFIIFFKAYNNWIEYFNYLNINFSKILFVTTTFPLLMIISLPTHAFSKYYLFLIPIFLKILSKFFEKKQLIIFVFLISFLSILEVLRDKLYN